MKKKSKTRDSAAVRRLQQDVRIIIGMLTLLAQSRIAELTTQSRKNK